ncbi:MAG: cytochrome P450 [Sphingomonadaceae bacterium]|uniref:cytochrome P450 n=1 Tax=Thermaurantiacus sp. TaxID=2820283 RepID=UPI00298F14E1|nr:cytochrome P450 [Thermaurantiacus sp.]MCS6987212.1 cytochrome P450 [Sphingomonadaceae bacterium]MDW8414432.1 cytochrome P450 [Thermaurantiacus sp.]
MATLAQPLAPQLPLEILDLSKAQDWLEYRNILERFRILRAAGPVHYCPESGVGPYWSVVTHHHVMEVEGRPDVFSSRWDVGGITIFDRKPEVDEPPLPMFIAMDRPEHTEKRRTVAPAFTPAEMLRHEPLVRRRTAELLDSLPLGEPFDWVDRVSIELTTGMLAILFDFPWEDRRLLTFWSDTATDVEAFENPERDKERWAVLYEMAAYFMRLWNERKDAEPRPDLISMLAHAPATRHMSPQEFMGNLVLLIVGGNDTTRNTMSGAVMAQNLWPDDWNRMMADPALIENGVSELIRWQTPLAHMRRTALVDTELAGQRIRAGDKVVMWYLSANRDEAVFLEADRFLPERPNARRHLSFGFGIHRCVGARLAELQVRVLLEEMQRRRLRVTLADEPVRVYSPFVHGFRKMPVVVDRA